MRMARDQKGGAPAEHTDFRRVLDMKDVDVVVVCTPDHWHAIPTILACQAGRDVFVEKPLSHNIREGRQMVDAARQHNRIVQMGTQQRSGAHFQEAVKIVQDGTLGRVTRVATWNHGNQSPHGFGNFPDSDPPPGLDWDLYLGPAPKVPFNPARFIWTFRWFWDYAGGMMTDWGVHHIDIVQWAMNVRAPRSVTAVGAKYHLRDNRDTPDTLEAIFEYPDFILTYSNRDLNRGTAARGYGIEFHGTDATMFLDRGGYEIIPESQGQMESPRPAYLAEIERFEIESARHDPASWTRPRRMRKGRTEMIVGEGSEQNLSHVRNFLDCVKSRRQPISDVDTGHASSSTAILGNIALRTGRTIVWDAEKEQVKDDAEANALLKRENREPWRF
jgi:predicted dehydrogenase